MFKRKKEILIANDNMFFCFEDYYTIKLMLIEKDECKQLETYKIFINVDKSSAFDLNEDFLVLNSLDKIFLIIRIIIFCQRLFI